MRKRKRQVVKKLIQCAAIIAAGVLAIILFMLAIWYRGKNSEPEQTAQYKFSDLQMSLYYTIYI